MESSYNNKIYKYSIRDTTEPLGDGSESSSSGGSGNYSTAQLTITNTIEDEMAGFITAVGPCVDNVTIGVPTMAPAAYIQDGETITLTVVLYKGRCVFGIIRGTTELEYEYEGNVEQLVLPIGKYHVITGDATIIVSGEDTIYV